MWHYLWCRKTRPPQHHHIRQEIELFLLTFFYPVNPAAGFALALVLEIDINKGRNHHTVKQFLDGLGRIRSEERRVGKECRL